MPSVEVGLYSCHIGHIGPYVLSTITPEKAKRNAKLLLYFLPWSMIELIPGDRHPLECTDYVRCRYELHNYTKAHKTCPIAPPM